MKNIIIIGLLILSSISCKSQIIAVEDFTNYANDLEDGAYVKDINNVLDKFVGTWKGTHNNKNYEFKIVKFTEDNLELKYKFDMLLMRYKITDSNGTVLVNTLSLPNSDSLVVNGSYLTNTGGYVLYYQGENSDCGQNGDIFISVGWNNSNNNMKLFLHVYGEMDGCLTSAAIQMIPIEQILLIKQ